MNLLDGDTREGEGCQNNGWHDLSLPCPMSIDGCTFSIPQKSVLDPSRNTILERKKELIRLLCASSNNMRTVSEMGDRD